MLVRARRREADDSAQHRADRRPDHGPDVGAGHGCGDRRANHCAAHVSTADGGAKAPGDGCPNDAAEARAHQHVGAGPEAE